MFVAAITVSMCTCVYNVYDCNPAFSSHFLLALPQTPDSPATTTPASLASVAATSATAAALALASDRNPGPRMLTYLRFLSPTLKFCFLVLNNMICVSVCLSVAIRHLARAASCLLRARRSKVLAIDAGSYASTLLLGSSGGIGPLFVFVAIVYLWVWCVVNLRVDVLMLVVIPYLFVQLMV